MLLSTPEKILLKRRNLKMTKELPLGCLQTFKNLDELNSYILDRVNHETDIIMESEWFDEIIERKVKAAIKGMT